MGRESIYYATLRVLEGIHSCLRGFWQQIDYIGIFIRFGDRGFPGRKPLR